MGGILPKTFPYPAAIGGSQNVTPLTSQGPTSQPSSAPMQPPVKPVSPSAPIATPIISQLNPFYG